MLDESITHHWRPNRDAGTWLTTIQQLLDLPLDKLISAGYNVDDTMTTGEEKYWVKSKGRTKLR